MLDAWRKNNIRRMNTNITVVAKIAMASSDIAWICGQCTFKNEGREPGPCHFCQAPHPKRKAVVVSMPTSAPALPNAAAPLAVASASLVKPVGICQPARSSGFVIDLSAPDAAPSADTQKCQLWHHIVVMP